MRRTKKKNNTIIILVALLLAIGIGYAAFGSQLNITGTATARGNWDVHFDNLEHEDDTNKTASLSQDGKTLTINSDLTQEGESDNIAVDIVNEGSVDAELKNFILNVKNTKTQATISAVEGGTYTNGILSVTFMPENVGTTASSNEEFKTIPAGGSATYTIQVDWDVDENDTRTEIDDETTFEVTFNYAQPTT